MVLPAPEHPHEPIIVDGSNVALGASLSALQSLVADATQQGWECLVIVDASLRHRLSPDEAEILEEHLMDGWVQVPKGTDADVHVLAEAERLDAWVISGDQFRDHTPPRRRLDPAVLLA